MADRRYNRLIIRMLALLMIICVIALGIDRGINLNAARPCTTEESKSIQQYIANAITNTPKPKAAIHYLIQSNSEGIQNLIQSLRSLDKYFNNKFNYPVILFHENDLSTELRKVVTDATQSFLIFQNVTFNIPDFVRRPVPEYLYGKNIGYRHMCRFQAKGVYDQPIMKKLDYVWRLDDDSLLRSDIPYDIFRYMSDNDLVYGYIQINYESRRRSRNLWPLVEAYIKNNNIKTQNFENWPIRQQFYNNFEVSATWLWHSEEYQHYFNVLDRTGGIYHHVWGDATIKAMAVNMFVPFSKTHYFCDIGYEHETLSKKSW